MGLLSSILGGGSSKKSTTTTTTVDSSTKIGDIGLTGNTAVDLARVLVRSVEKQQDRNSKNFETLTGIVASAKGLLTPQTILVVGAILVVGLVASK